MKMFKKVLIANRGEIACRVIETCRRLGIRSVAVYSDADREARHVKLADEAYHIGGPRPTDSYLKGDVILAIAKAQGVEAIHPGYGFLSENTDFARACEAAGVVFIGPTPEAIDKMGSKSAAKKIMDEAGVPIVPGYHGDQQEAAFLQEEAERVGYPLLIKAVAGGGGKGMRLVRQTEEFFSQLEAARREAKNAFGNEDVLLERFVEGPRHIEFQVFGDSHGQVVHLFERECSIQRRHQKILEETPSPFLDETMRAAMGEAAVKAAQAIHYVGAGTIEFIVGANREFFFMEMNTRLQVEHPVTEMTTGQDLVEWQLRVAAGEPLPLTQAEITRQGHAIEVRVYAENPANQFLPETGTLKRYYHPVPDGKNIRIDTGVVEGDTISIFYDPMIAKLIVWGQDRHVAISRLRHSLNQMGVIGLVTNIPFLSNLVTNAAFIAGTTDTLFVDTYLTSLLPQPETELPDLAVLGALAQVVMDEEAEAAQGAQHSADPFSPWHQPSTWRLNTRRQRRVILANPLKAANLEILLSGVKGQYRATLLDDTKNTYDFRVTRLDENRLRLAFADTQIVLTVLREQDALTVFLADQRFDLIKINPFVFESADEVPGGRLTAAMPGRIAKVFVSVGDQVEKGQPLLILEAMKMEHTIHSPRDGVIERIVYQVDQIVEADAVLFAFKEDETATA